MGIVLLSDVLKPQARTHSSGKARKRLLFMFSLAYPGRLAFPRTFIFGGVIVCFLVLLVPARKANEP